MRGHGTFFDVTNRSSTEVHISGFAAGSGECAGTTQATLYVCKKGASICNERDRSAWKRVWSGSLHEFTSTKISLDRPVTIGASSTTGFCLHSPDHAHRTMYGGSCAVALSEPCAGAADATLCITPGYSPDEDPFGGGNYTPKYNHFCRQYREFGEALIKAELRERANPRKSYKDNPYKFTPAGWIEYQLPAGVPILHSEAVAKTHPQPHVERDPEGLVPVRGVRIEYPVNDFAGRPNPNWKGGLGVHHGGESQRVV